MKYIDAEKLIAEIERLIKVNKELKSSRFTEGIAAGYGDVLSAITSIQQEQPQVADASKMEQPEVDLEKALDEYYKNADFGPSEAIEYETHKDIARHFYELGLNARK